MTSLDPRVLQFADAAGLHVRERGGALELASSDTSLVVRSDGGTIRVESTERGVVEGVDLVTTSQALLDRFAAPRIGVAWRSRHRLGHLRAPGPLDAPVGVTGRERPDGWAEIASPTDDAEVASVHDARRLARAAAFGLEEVIASLQDPAGAPVFSNPMSRGALTGQPKG